MPHRRGFASGDFVYHVLNPCAPWHAIVFCESQPTIRGATGFEDVLEDAKDCFNGGSIRFRFRRTG
jgi:hypothetical protein